MTRWQTELATVGMLNVGEFWRETKCDGCGAGRACLSLELWEAYDAGAQYVDLCAQCLRDLASDLDRFENEPKDDPHDEQ